MKVVKSKLFLIFLISIFLFVSRIWFIFPTFSDEIFYLNIGKVLMQTDKVLYKDIFFAHPPLQPYFISLLWIFLKKFFLVKLFWLFVSSLMTVLNFLLVREVWNEEIAFFSSLLFIFSVPFFVFSFHFLGMWESFLLLIISSILFAKRKIFVSSLIFSLAIFTRYLSFAFVPVFILIGRKKKISLKKFFLLASAFSFLLSSLFFFLFGPSFFDQSILFHLRSKVFSNFEQKDYYQYLLIQFPSIFIFLLAGAMFWRKKFYLSLFSIFYLTFDLILVFFLNQLAFHYFIFSFYAAILLASLIFFDSRLFEVKFFVVFIFILFFFTNFKTMLFYFNKNNFEFLKKVNELVCDGCKVFGDPILMNYVILSGKAKPMDNWYDTYPRHIKEYGVDKIVREIEKERPILIFCDRFYDRILMSLKENYRSYASISSLFGTCRIYTPS